MLVPTTAVALKPGRLNRRVVATLQKQGLIEPIQVRDAGICDGTQLYSTFDEDPYGDDRVRAAAHLGWPTVLVAVMGRYEP
jgi:hypothetical protein